MASEKKSDVGYASKYKRNDKVAEGVFDDPEKENTEYEGGVAIRGVCGGG